MLAMAGIAFLLLFVVFAITHATNLYSKGVAVRQINQVGRQISDELSRELRYSGGEPKILTVPHRICVGSKSYIWNNADTLDADANKNAAGERIDFVRLNNGSYCDADAPDIPSDEPELLGNIARLMDMTITEPVSRSGVYEIKMVFGTALNLPVKQPLSQRYECSPVDGQFCAVGEFEATVYVRGR